jgi:uncharacterized protein YwqG
MFWQYRNPAIVRIPYLMRYFIGLVLLAIIVMVGAMIQRSRARTPTAAAQARLPAAKPITADADVDAFLAKYETALQATQRPSVDIRLEATTDDDPRASKVGGRPYWAEGRDYPVGANGAPLHLLAQIDFAALPSSLDGYPKAGLLQFFIASDDHYGADFDSGMTADTMSAQRNFRVVYWPDTRAGHRDVDVPAAEYLPHDPARPRRMRFSAATETLGVHDHRFDRLLGGDAHAAIETYAKAHRLDADALFDAVYERNGRGGHKIGGYPFFTQQDPRTDDRLELLLQLDTDDQMMWGDSGVGGFFIAPEDLARADFSRVMYSWDCH